MTALIARAHVSLQDKDARDRAPINVNQTPQLSDNFLEKVPTPETPASLAIRQFSTARPFLVVTSDLAPGRRDASSCGRQTAKASFTEPTLSLFNILRVSLGGSRFCEAQWDNPPAKVFENKILRRVVGNFAHSLTQPLSCFCTSPLAKLLETINLHEHRRGQESAKELEFEARVAINIDLSYPESRFYPQLIEPHRLFRIFPLTP